MGIIVSSTGAELMAGDKHNVMSDFEGTAMLAPSRNLIPDPRFDHYDAATGTLRYWLLGFAPKPNGWMPFVRDNNIEKNFSRQHTSPLSMDTASFDIADELVPGASPRDKKDTIDIASPVKPMVKTYSVSKHVGLPAGWYCMAMGYIAGDKRSKRLTGPGPRSDAFQVAQGQGLQMAALNELPEGVGAVVYYLTPPQPSADAAYAAGLYEQQRYDLKGLPRFWNFYGPLSTRRKWDGKNHTFIGSDPGKLTVQKKSSRLGKGRSSRKGSGSRTRKRSGGGGGGTSQSARSESITASFRFTSDQGTGKSTGQTQIENTGQTQGEGIVVTIKPASFPEGATGYVPEITTKDQNTGAQNSYDMRKSGGSVPDSGSPTSAPQSGGSSQQGQVTQYQNTENYKSSNTGNRTKAGDRAGAFGKNERAPVYGGRPEDVPDGSGVTMEQSAGASTTDETGVERPSDVAAVPTILDLNTSGLTPGKHFIRTALMVGEDEGPVSPPRDIHVAIGQGLRIFRPHWHDRLDNSDLSEKQIEAVWEPNLNVFVGEDFIPSNPNGYRYRVMTNGTTGAVEPTWGTATVILKDGITYHRIGADRTGRPRNWDLLTTTSNTTQVSSKTGVLRIDDVFNNSDDADFFVSPPAELSPQHDRYTLNFRFKYREVVSGAMDMYLVEYNEAGQQVAAKLMERIGKNAKNKKKDKQNRPKALGRNYRLSRRDGDVASPQVTKLHPDTVTIALRVRGKIGRKQPTRWFAVDFSDFHVSAGWGSPRVLDVNLLAAQRTPMIPAPDEVPDIEYQNFRRPHGGYCVVVTDPDDGPKKDVIYGSKDYTVFETGQTEGWVKSINNFNTYVNEVRREAALFSNYGLELAKTEDGTGGNNVQKVFTPDTQMTVSWDLFIDTFSSHDIELGSIRDANNVPLASVILRGNGDVTVRHSNAHEQTVELGIDNGNLVHFSLSCNLITGVVTLRFGVDLENSAQVVELTGISFATFENAARAVIGPSTASAVNNFARFSLKYGKIEVTKMQVVEGYSDIPGNYIEYYGPDGTPRNNTYGPRGLRVPAKPNMSYTFGVNVWYQDMSPNSDLYIIRAMDSDHRVLRTYAPLVDNMTGDKQRWQRHFRTVETPANTAYFEFYENKLGAGLLRIHGLQMEEGTVGTEFNSDRERSGWFNTFLRTRHTAIEPGDPAFELGRIKQLRNIHVAVLDDDDISTLVRYRSGNTFAELDAQPYTNNYALVDPSKDIFEVRMDMSSMVDGKTPEVRSVELDVARNTSQLLRPDGTEYAGGTVAHNITTPAMPPNMENVDLATGQRITQEWGMHRIQTIKFDLQAFRRSDVEAILSQSTHILELPFARFVLGLNSVPEFSPEPGSRIYFPDGREFFQRETASFDCYVIGMESLV